MLEAQAVRTATFDIPAQPLSQALATLGRQSGLQVTVDPTVVAGKTSAAVAGPMTADQALRQILSSSGLTYQISGNTVSVAGPPATAAPTTGSNVIQIDPVRVQADTAPPQAEIGNLPPVYAGGQVARGGKVGLLGNRDYMDTPLARRPTPTTTSGISRRARSRTCWRPTRPCARAIRTAMPSTTAS